MDRCPKCGAAYSHRGCTHVLHRRYTKYACNYVEYDDGTSDEARNCLHNQLAALRALLVEAHTALNDAEDYLAGGVLADLLARIEAAVGKEAPDDAL